MVPMAFGIFLSPLNISFHIADRPEDGNWPLRSNIFPIGYPSPLANLIVDSATREVTANGRFGCFSMLGICCATATPIATGVSGEPRFQTEAIAGSLAARFGQTSPTIKEILYK